MSYINTDDFLELFAVASIGQDKQFINTVKMVLEDTPIADVVDVVRCKDCKHFIKDIFNRTACNRTFDMFGVLKDDFCSYGERKE